MRPALLYSLCLTWLTIGCDDTGDADTPPLDATLPAEDSAHAEDAALPDAAGPDAATEATLSLDFERLGDTSPHPFRVTVTATGTHDAPLVEAPRGEVGALEDLGEGVYRFVVTPAHTGEHPVTVSAGDLSVTRTAVVLSSVHPDWGQPMAVEGLVNTVGYEDGLTITPDGEYLFVQYGAFAFSGISLFATPRERGGCGGHRLMPDRCTHPWLDDVRGPIGAPERPGYYQGRISADGQTWRHNAASWQVEDEQAPNLALSTQFFGFKRQPDGSFADPFYVAFDDQDDGLMGPFGLSFLQHDDGTTTVAFAFNDPANTDLVDLDGDGIDDVESLVDVYTAPITLGEDTILGTYVAADEVGTPPVRGEPFLSRVVDFGSTGIEGLAGTQGNPHLHAPDGELRAIFTDDEFDTGGDHGDLSVHVLEAGSLEAGTWRKVLLPPAVNAPSPANEIQPFFDSQSGGLYFARLGDGPVPAIRFAAYDGAPTAGDYGDPAHWTDAVDILTASELVEGGTLALGEPTLTHRGGVTTLYFIYVIVRGFDAATGLPDLDLQAGFVERR